MGALSGSRVEAFLAVHAEAGLSIGVALTLIRDVWSLRLWSVLLVVHLKKTLALAIRESRHCAFLRTFQSPNTKRKGSNLLM